MLYSMWDNICLSHLFQHLNLSLANQLYLFQAVPVLPHPGQQQGGPRQTREVRLVQLPAILLLRERRGWTVNNTERATVNGSETRS